MATKLPAAQRRLFKNAFVCRNCNQKIKTDPIRVVQKMVKCRRCGGRVFRPVRTKKK
jgi:DNA-directed RNA polymerase subunit RPC12/RpoP